MGIRISVQAAIAFLLLVVLISDGSYPGVYTWLGTATSIAAVDVAAQAVLVLVTVQTVGLLFFLGAGLAQAYIDQWLDGPVFRLAHTRIGGTGRRSDRPRRLLLSERALSNLTSMRSANETARERVQSFLLPFGRVTSFPTLALTVLLVLVTHWSVAAVIATDIATGVIGTSLSSNVEFVIAVTAFLLSLAPYVVLLVLLFSSAGRRARLRNNSQIVSDATYQLAQLHPRLLVVMDAAYRERSHLIDTRRQRAMAVITEASGSRIGWHDAGSPSWSDDDGRRSWREASDVAVLPHPRVGGVLDRRLHDDLRRAIKDVKHRVKEIDRLGLSSACAEATAPIASRLRSIQLSFWPSRDAKGGIYGPDKPKGALAVFLLSSAFIESGIDTQLREGIEAQLRWFESVRMPNREDGTGRRRRRVHLVDLSEDAIDDVQYVDLLEGTERYIASYCERMDKELIRDGARQDSLWRVGAFVHRHVLGGRIDTLAERLT